MKAEKARQGVGIDDIRQPEKGSFITVLTDGRTRKIQLPPPEKGEPGERGDKVTGATLDLLERPEKMVLMHCPALPVKTVRLDVLWM